MIGRVQPSIASHVVGIDDDDVGRRRHNIATIRHNDQRTQRKETKTAGGLREFHFKPQQERELGSLIHASDTTRF